jgi:hypothetical protein
MPSAHAHRRLVNLLCLSLLTAGGMAACGAVLPAQQDRPAAAFQTYDQVVESFGQIVPGMTQAQDLPSLGFDTRNGEALSPDAIKARFLLDGAHGRPLIPAVRDCIKAEVYCSGYVFHASHRGKKPLFMGVGGGRPWSAEITLLVMNGRVTHKVLT